MMKSAFLTFAILFLTASHAYSHEINQNHSCIKPSTNIDFSDAAAVKTFEGNLRAFNNCMLDYINMQTQEGRAHMKETDKAIAEIARVGKELQWKISPEVIEKLNAQNDVK